MPEPPGFDSFWKAYPRKRAKLDAQKAWKQTAKVRPELGIVLNAIAAQKGSRGWLKHNGDFIPYPATWLRAGQWDDEVETSANYDQLGNRNCAGCSRIVFGDAEFCGQCTKER